MSADHNDMLSKNPTSSQSLRRFVGESSYGFDPLHPNSFLDVQVSGQKDGKVLLSVVLPANMTRGFVTFLESMMNLMSQADRKEMRAHRETRPLDLDEEARKDEFRENFESRVCTLYRDYLSRGMESKEAIKRTNLALKDENHPWATYETVKKTLSSRGALKRARPGPAARRRPQESES